MPADVVIGLDVGTQSSKLVACDATGGMLAEERIAHGVSRPGPGRFEQDAEAVWWRDVATLLLTAEGASRSPSARRLRQRHRPDGVADQCRGTPAAAGHPLRHRHARAARDRRTHRALRRARDRRHFRLGHFHPVAGPETPVAEGARAGRVQSDAALVHRACLASLEALRRLRDRPPLREPVGAALRCREGGVAERYLVRLLPGVAAPELVWPGDAIGSITAEASAATGLPMGTPVVMGTVDAWSEAYSAYAEAPGRAMIMYGSTFFFIANSDRFVASPRFWGTHSVSRRRLQPGRGMATGGLCWIGWRASSHRRGRHPEARGRAADRARRIARASLFLRRAHPLADPDCAPCSSAWTSTPAPARSAAPSCWGWRSRRATISTRSARKAAAGATMSRSAGGASAPAFLRSSLDVGGIRQIVPHRTIGAALGDARLAAEAIGWETPQGAWNPTDRIAKPSPARAPPSIHVRPLQGTLPADETARTARRIARYPAAAASSVGTSSRVRPP